MSDLEIKFTNLQSKYTDLLEKRIAQLEAALATPLITPGATAAPVKLDGKKKEDDDRSEDEKSKDNEKDVRFCFLHRAATASFVP
jgi:hypothetical protein